VANTPQSRQYVRKAMIAMALVLPALSLIPLGSLWLWDHGYLLYWVGAALLLSIASYLTEVWAIGATAMPSTDQSAWQTSTVPDATWTATEVAALTAVDRLASSIDPTTINSRDALLDLGLRTIETVARTIHPTDKDPLWRFTVPEALTLIERVAQELRPFVVDTIPLGDQLTVGQVLRIYSWRSAFGVAEKAYDLWRIVRLINPVAAVTNEARERLTKALYTGVRDELAKRLTQGFVKEVGRAAIDLYGGRLKGAPTAQTAIAIDATAADATLAAQPSGWRWPKLMSQAFNAGRAATRALSKTTRSKTPRDGK
jgi:uncharacterized protein